MQNLCRPPQDRRSDPAGLLMTLQAAVRQDSGFRLRMGIVDCTVHFRFWHQDAGGVFCYGETDRWRYDPAGGLAVLPLREQIPAGVELVVPIVTFYHNELALLNFVLDGAFRFEIGERRDVFAVKVRREPGETRLVPILGFRQGVPPQDLYVARWEKTYRPLVLLFHGRAVVLAAVPPLPECAPPEGLVPPTMRAALRLAEVFFDGPPPCIFEADETRTAGSTMVRCFYVFPVGSSQDTLLREESRKAAAGRVKVCPGSGNVSLELGAEGELTLRDGARRRPWGGSLLLCGASLVVATGSVIAFRFSLRGTHFRSDPVLRAWLFTLPMDVAWQIDARLAGGGDEGSEQARAALGEQLPATELDHAMAGDLGGVGDVLQRVVEEEVQGVVGPEVSGQAAGAGDETPEIGPENVVFRDLENGRNEAVAGPDVHGAHAWWRRWVPGWLRAA